MHNRNLKSFLAHPPLSGKSLTERDFWVFESPIFGGKKQAFTLAEVLITLVIIGVIAALTIPNLMQKYQEQTTVKKVQKFYSNLSNAYALSSKDNGPANEWDIVGHSEEHSTKIYNLLFKPYFKIAKDCGTKYYTGKECLADVNYKNLNNTETGNYAASNYYKMVLDDSATVWTRACSEDQLCDILVIYDTNGKKSPNQYGRDLFNFVIKKDKPVPYGIQSGEYSYFTFNSYCKDVTTIGIGCAAWVIYKGNMDYLHCSLTWDKHSCKD